VTAITLVSQPFHSHYNRRTHSYHNQNTLIPQPGMPTLAGAGWLSGRLVLRACWVGELSWLGELGCWLGRLGWLGGCAWLASCPGRLGCLLPGWAELSRLGCAGLGLAGQAGLCQGGWADLGGLSWLGWVLAACAGLG